MQDPFDVFGRRRLTEISDEFGVYIGVVGNSKIFSMIFESLNSDREMMVELCFSLQGQLSKVDTKLSKAEAFKRSEICLLS